MSNHNVTITPMGFDEILLSKDYPDTSSSMFSFQLLSNSTGTVRDLIADRMRQQLRDLLDWLDEPPTDWSRLMSNLPPLPGSIYAQTPKEEVVVA